MANSQIVGVIYDDDHLIIQRLDGSQQIRTHPSLASSDGSRDWRKEIVEALRKADADALEADRIAQLERQANV